MLLNSNQPTNVFSYDCCNSSLFFGRPLVKRFALCYRTIVLSVCPVLSCPVVSCPVLSVCLSVMLVYCGQTVGWIKMKLGMEVGLGPVHTALDGTLLPLTRGTAPKFLNHVHCGQMARWIKMPNSWMHRHTTWYRYEGRLQPRRHCVRWEPSSP